MEELGEERPSAPTVKIYKWKGRSGNRKTRQMTGMRQKLKVRKVTFFLALAWEIGGRGVPPTNP